MKYQRKLKSGYYQGCNDRLARAIDRMAGFEEDTLTEQPSYRWRGDTRVVNSALDRHYEKHHGGK